MAETNIDNSVASDLTSSMVSYSVGGEETDGVPSAGELVYQLKRWSEFLGYYKSIPELQTAVDALALWTMGAGFEAEPRTELLLGTIKGHGKDSFNSILSNMIRVYTIAGDSYAEIIRDPKGMLVNLKPLDPSSIAIIYSTKGRIIRYEQKSKNKVDKRFKPSEILHLSRKRIADEVHGISVIPSVEVIINMRNEAMSDWKRVLHRNISPLIIWHLDTDDTAQIASFKAKTDAATALGENMYIPKGTVVPEVLSTAQNATLNPLAWINQLNDYFFQAVMVPQIIIGQGKEFTDASGKITYLAYEQSVKGGQLYVEEQVLSQLGLEINLTFPATMQNEMITSRDKDSQLQASQPNDTTAELEGRT